MLIWNIVKLFNLRVPSSHINTSNICNSLADNLTTMLRRGNKKAGYILLNIVYIGENVFSNSVLKNSKLPPAINAILMTLTNTSTITAEIFTDRPGLIDSVV